jgi:hypothetical protein
VPRLQVRARKSVEHIFLAPLRRLHLERNCRARRTPAPESRARGRAPPRLPVHASRPNARNLELSDLRAREQARNQRPKFLVRQRCKLQQVGVPHVSRAFLGRDTERRVVRVTAVAAS